jgi:hypothetical protein
MARGGAALTDILARRCSRPIGLEPAGGKRLELNSIPTLFRRRSRGQVVVGSCGIDVRLLHVPCWTVYTRVTVQ